MAYFVSVKNPNDTSSKPMVIAMFWTEGHAQGFIDIQPSPSWHRITKEDAGWGVLDKLVAVETLIVENGVHEK